MIWKNSLKVTAIWQSLWFLLLLLFWMLTSTKILLVMSSTTFSSLTQAIFARFEFLSHREVVRCELLYLKPGLYLNANRTRMQHAKMMRTFDVDVLLRWGKQHSAVWQTFGQQLNVICQLSVLQRKFTYDTFRCRCTGFIFFTFGDAANSFALTNKQPGDRVYSLPRRMLNNVQMYHISNVRIIFTCRVYILFTLRCKPSLILLILLTCDSTAWKSC